MGRAGGAARPSEPEHQSQRALDLGEFLPAQPARAAADAGAVDGADLFDHHACPPPGHLDLGPEARKRP